MNRLRSLFITISILPACLHAEPLKPEVVKRAAKAIDTYLERDYSSYRVMPEARVDDGTFVRRAYLLIVGRIPTAEEAKTFIEERSMDKRAKLIDRLVASPGYESHFFNWAGDLLRVRTITGREKHGLGWHVWLRKSVSEDKHWDDMVKEMLKSSGHAAKDPAVGYYLRDRNMQLDNFSNTMQVFLGQQMGCAQCHDHPFDDWTQYDYYQMAAFTGGMQYRSEDLQAMVKRVAEENRNGKANTGNAKANRRQEMGMMRATGRSLQPFFRYLNNDAVLETRDLPEALGMTQTTLNRTMRSMADRSYIHENGFKLLRVSTHPTDERQRIVELTPKGKELAINMQRIIYDG